MHFKFDNTAKYRKSLKPPLRGSPGEAIKTSGTYQKSLSHCAVVPAGTKSDEAAYTAEVVRNDMTRQKLFKKTNNLLNIKIIIISGVKSRN